MTILLSIFIKIDENKIHCYKEYKSEHYGYIPVVGDTIIDPIDKEELMVMNRAFNYRISYVRLDLGTLEWDGLPLSEARKMIKKAKWYVEKKKE